MKINLIVAHNYAGSITKLTWMYARELADKNHDVCIYYPWLVDQLDHQLFTIKTDKKSYTKLLSRLILKLLLRNLIPGDFGLRLIRRPTIWSGLVEFGHLNSVKIKTYTFWPNNLEMRDADATISMQTQLLPTILNLKGHGTIIDSLHLSNFETDEKNGSWFKHIFKIARHINVSRFAVSALVMQEAKRAHKIDVKGVINNGVDIENFPFTPLSQRDSGILMFCDPRPQKGFDCGLKVLKILKEKYPNLKFASVGNVKGLDTNFFNVVHGFVPGTKIGAVYGKYKYFFMSSLFEGFPAPPLEAMATGAICILSKTAGIEEYGVSGGNCLLFEPGNIEEAVLRFESILSNPELAEHISQNAPATASNYSWKASAEKLLELME